MPAAIKDADSTKEAQLLESWKAYKKGFQEGIALFNKKPKKGIAFMQVGHVPASLDLPCSCPSLHVHVCRLASFLAFFLCQCSSKLSELSPVAAVDLCVNSFFTPATNIGEASEDVKHAC